MRKSQARSGIRPLRAGIAVAATAALVVVGIATPAFAAPITTTIAGPAQIPTQGGGILFATGTNAFDEAVYGRLIPSATATCPGDGLAGTPSATNVELTAVNISLPDANSAIIKTPALTAGTWRLCTYDVDNNASSGESTSTTVTAVPMGALSAGSGPAAGGNQITMTATGLFAATVATQFVRASESANGCPTNYTAAATGTYVAATQSKTNNQLTITVPTSLTVNNPYWICTYNGSSAGNSTLVARSATTYAPYAATLPGSALTPAAGSSGTESFITLTTAVNTFTGTPDVYLSKNACPATRGTLAAGVQFTATVQKISSGKLAITVPTSVLVNPGEPTTAVNVCAYASSSGSAALVAAPGIYTVAPVLSVAGVDDTAGTTGGPNSDGPSVSPISGPAQGGTQITIYNLVGIPTAEGAILKASLGGSTLENVRATDSTTITGTTTAHAPGLVNLSVTTAAGTKTTAFDTATEGVFKYTYGVNVTPNTAPPTPAANPVLDVMGAGFSNLVFLDITGTGTNNNGTRAHVLLTDNSWYTQQTNGLVGAGIANAFVAGAVTQCKTVLPISDGELICTLDLANSITNDATMTNVIVNSTDVKPGTYQITVINHGGAAVGNPLRDINYNYSVISSGSTFTVSPF